MGAKPTKVAMAGLDGAGKTTLLSRFVGYEQPPLQPGQVIKRVESKAAGVQLHSIDSGGNSKWRPLNRLVMDGASALVWVVDSCDIQRLDAIGSGGGTSGTSADELSLLLPLSDPLLPVLVLATKLDLSSQQTTSIACSTATATAPAPAPASAPAVVPTECVLPVDLARRLHLFGTGSPVNGSGGSATNAVVFTGETKQREWRVQPCSNVTGAGLVDGFNWLAAALYRFEMKRTGGVAPNGFPSENAGWPIVFLTCPFEYPKGPGSLGPVQQQLVAADNSTTAAPTTSAPAAAASDTGGTGKASAASPLPPK